MITIDVQKGFHDPHWGNRNQPDCEKNIETCLRFWRAQNLPIIHVKHRSLEDDSPLRPERPGFQFMDFLVPEANERIIEKTVNSAFIGTDLEKILKESNFENLVFVGFTSDHCVSTSCRMGANLGFSCTIVSDAVATFDRTHASGEIFPAELVHRVGLASLSGEFAEIRDTHSLTLNRNVMQSRTHDR